MNDNTQDLKGKIVDGYRRGVCDHNGKTIPKANRGQAGKGSRFRPAKTQQYRDNYDRIEWDLEND